jgi:hypothetical protein
MRVTITFQGGFVGTRCALQVAAHEEDTTTKRTWLTLTRIYPENVNKTQTFTLPPDLGLEKGVQSLKLVFEESSDFFGRIVVYNLKLDGTVLTEP